MKKDTNNKAFWAISVLCACSLVLLLLQSAHYWKSMIDSERSADKLVKSEVQKAVETVGGAASKIEGIADSIAGDMAGGRLNPDSLQRRIQKDLAENRRINDIGVVVEGSEEDYAKADWFKEALNSKGLWTEPFRSKKGDLVVAYAVGFRAKGSSGVAYVSVTLDAIRHFARTLRFGDTGYCYILSRKGAFIYHPVKEAAESQKTIFDIAKAGQGPRSKDFLEAVKKAMEGQTVKLDIANPVTGQRFRLFYAPLPRSGWSLGSVFFADEIFTDEDIFRKLKMWITLTAVAFLSLFIALIFRAYNASQSGLWCTSAAFSILSICGAFYIWHLAVSAPLVEDNKRMVFTDMPSLSRFIDDYSSSFTKANKPAPYYIPTGIFIESIEFSSSNDLNISGYVWQKYRDGIHDKLDRGFLMPEAKTIDVKEAYRKKTGNTEVIGWYFEATLRESFNYSKYPFDRPDIYIWLKHKDLFENVVLVPDLAAYRFITPASTPGLQEDLTLPGYTFLGAYFDHEYHIRRSNLGVASDNRPDRTPEFFYNIVVRRNFITPFVSRLFPLFIMFSILFVVQLMFSQDEEKKKAFGLNAFAVMGVVITFFFSTLLSQNSLRQELNVDKIIFIEYFHFVAYLILLLVTIKTLLFIGGKNIKFVQYKQGLIPKLLYWPLFTGSIFLVSFINFYK